MFRKIGRSLGTALSLAGLGIPVLSLPAPATAASALCTRTTVAVRVSASDPTTYQLAGWLCGQGSLRGKTVQVLVHGLTYDHNYWDFPYSPETYSYVRRAVGAGYATFNIDRLGDGRSDRPADANAVTVSSGAFVLHQLVQALRAGTIPGGVAFATVLLVSHSLGAAISLYEAGTYADVDGAIITGQLHQPNPLTYLDLANFYLAQIDPKFFGTGVPVGYLTTIPGTRGGAFYNTAYADRTVIAQDEVLKQTLTLGELSSINDASDPALSQRIHVPVLVSVGQYDSLFCNELAGYSCAGKETVAARETAAYSPQACLETYVLPYAGHDINLHLNAPSWFDAALDWSDRRVGRSPSHPPTQPCPTG